MDRRQWRTAYRDLRKLIDAHENEPYVKLRRIEVEEAMKRCAFHKEHETPPLEDLVSADRVTWEASSGTLKVSYEIDYGSNKKALRDFEEIGPNSYLHPALFEGPFSIELRGNDYPKLIGSSPKAFPLLVAGFESGESWRAFFGFPRQGQYYYTARLLHVVGEDQAELDTMETSPVEHGEEFTMRFEIGHSVLKAFYDRKRILQGDKKRGVYGQAGFTGFELDQIDEIKIEGLAQASWVQNLIDTAMSESRANFESSYRADDHLPMWLFIDDASERGVVREGPPVPGPYVEDQMYFVEEALDFYNRQEFQQGLRYLDGLHEDDLTQAARSYLLAEFYFMVDDIDQAELHARSAWNEDPGFLAVRILNARILAKRGQRAPAIELLKGLVAQYPEDAGLRVELAQVLLLDGRPDEAKDSLDLALSLGVSPGEVAEVNRLLVKALNGPRWEKVYEHESRHYHVYSDVDVDICREASRVLETAYLGYTHHLQRARDPDRKFRVYLFSGERGYLTYLKNVLGTQPESTAGVYIPILKQLLIWNLPDRENMMRTVRHEGFHQYLDSLASDVPVWFNEGMAEYYEIAGRERGQWTEGAVHPEHLRYFDSSSAKVYELADFMKLPRETFYRDMTGNYAQAWAIIHFLRSTTRRNEAIFKKMLQGLVDGKPGELAIADACKGVDLGKLHQDFLEHLRGLE